MRESIGIDSVSGGWAMPKAYSEDMRARVIAEVESGASRRAAAEEFDVSASTAIIWVKCFREKASLRKAAERTIPRLRRRIGRFAGTVTARESCNYFRHAGYE
jgi:transposase-like protein